MKKSPLPTILLVVLLVSALGSLLLCWMYVSNARELRRLQAQGQVAQNQLTVFNQLVNDVAEYSKTHPAVEPILESIGVKMIKPGTTSAAPAAAKPATK
jgi:hypothetical protein